MFYVLNKQKIYAYLVSIITVVLLFFLAGTFKFGDETIETMSNQNKLLPIYNVETEENKVALTMNCACLQLPMGQN